MSELVDVMLVKKNSRNGELLIETACDIDDLYSISATVLAMYINNSDDKIDIDWYVNFLQGLHLASKITKPITIEQEE